MKLSMFKRAAVGAAAALVMSASAGVALAQQKITIMPGAWSGATIEFLRQQIKPWEEKNNTKVEILNVPNNGTEILAIMQQNLAAENADIDINAMDVVWQGMLARYAVDMKQFFTPEEIAKYTPTTIALNTINDRLIAVPFYGDLGLFYYRADLLKKYGYSEPPKTWAEVKEMAEKVQAGERAAGNENFWGFVYPASVYEGFATDIVEWISSYGGGTWVDRDGNVTANNPNARAALEELTSWVGKIVPPGVTSYIVDDARGAFQSGNYLFMRNWPYAYASMQADGSAVKGKFAVAAIPHGPNGKSASGLGGWQLWISKFSKNPEQAADLIKFINSPENQKERMLKLARLPSDPELLKDADILKTYPWVEMVQKFDLVARPSGSTGTKYSQVSNAALKAVNDMMTGRAKVAERLEQLDKELNRIKGRGW
ncbi:ABC transporter substrate-binding protein [Ensifer sp. ENS06]|uniref:ABC transporter substrate-binding protein n=1 Tax=Ensifer sp. ENS06 TaxID=2769276 RepID=UPI00177CBBD0|nr:ABC transporter substrate-binding protein [Ensifer sp. ENS06]MBD9626985.1 ABC transporter substrate-binding protein [Ensifer sp. ENS06]